MRVSDVLRKAAAKLEKYGWVQGSSNYGVMRKPCCALGAIIAVSGSDGGGFAARERLKAVLGIGSITVWNDQSGRTAREVVSALRKAARGTPDGDERAMTTRGDVT